MNRYDIMMMIMMMMMDDYDMMLMCACRYGTELTSQSVRPFICCKC